MADDERDRIPAASDPLIDALGGLPARDVDPWRREQIRRQALRVLAREARRPRWWRTAERIYTLGLEPAFLVGVGGVYLAWAFRAVAEILSQPSLQ